MVHHMVEEIILHKTTTNNTREIMEARSKRKNYEEMILNHQEGDVMIQIHKLKKVGWKTTKEVHLKINLRVISSMTVSKRKDK